MIVSTTKTYVRCEARHISGLQCEKGAFSPHELHQASRGKERIVWSGTASALDLNGHNFISLSGMDPAKLAQVKVIRLKKEYDQIDFTDGDLAIYFPAELGGEIQVKV